MLFPLSFVQILPFSVIKTIPAAITTKAHVQKSIILSLQCTPPITMPAEHSYGHVPLMKT